MNWYRGIPKHLPTATGAYVPGMMDVMLGYDKKSPFFRLFYPTEQKYNIKDNSKKWIPWVRDDSYLIGISKVIMCYLFLIRIAFWWTDKIRIPALYGEKPRTQDKLKCVIMSHGLGGCRFLYTNICCELASRGFLVAALEHRDNSACHTYYYQNEEASKIDKRTHIDFKHFPFGADHYNKRNDQIRQRSAEIQTVLECLINIEKGNVPRNVIDNVLQSVEVDFRLEALVGNLNLESMTIMGHSFGAATALYCLAQRSEFRQGILLDPWMFPIKNEDLHKKITQPMLFINTQTFHIAANVKSMSEILNCNQKNAMYTIKHTTHENQTDSVLLVGYWLNWFMKKLNPLMALKINNALIMKFLATNCLHNNSNENEFDTFLNQQSVNIEEGLTKPWA